MRSRKNPLAHFGIAKSLLKNLNDLFEEGINLSRAKRIIWRKKKLNQLENLMRK